MSNLQLLNDSSKVHYLTAMGKLRCPFLGFFPDDLADDEISVPSESEEEEEAQQQGKCPSVVDIFSGNSFLKLTKWRRYGARYGTYF